MKNIRVLFLANNCIGVIYWRMFKYYEQMVKNKEILPGMFGLDWNNKYGVMQWEEAITKSAFVNDIKNDEFWKAMMATDVIVYGYSGHAGSMALIEMWKEMGKKVIVEIDDYIFNVPNYNPGFTGGKPGGKNTEKVAMEQMKMADAVVTTCDYMRREYLKFNTDIYVIKNSLDFTEWKAKPNKNKNVVVGWIGAANHNEDLRILEKVIPEVLAKYPNAEFKLVHGIPEYLKVIKHDRLKIVNVDKWVDIKDYPEYMSKMGFDIGLAPLLDNTFNRCKSNIRWLEYAGLKVPCVASNVENFRNTITDGKDGMLCDYEVKDWVNAIGALIEDKELRRSMGKEAYATAYKEFNVVKEAGKYTDVIKEVYKNESKRIASGSPVLDSGHGFKQSEVDGYDFN